MATAPSIAPRTVVLVGNPHSGHLEEGMERARRAILREGLQIVDTVHMGELERLRPWVRRPAGERPLIVAAGGDGTVGGVANYVAATEAALGIVPLGTSNDVARSLDIPLRVEDAVHLFTAGKISTIDAGRFTGEDGEDRYFVHAAAMGIDVAFSKIATRQSLRKRLGRLTYLVAAILALRDRRPFTCEMELEGRCVAACLLHLSVINAPVFGGKLGMRLGGSNVDDRRLDVLAIEDMPLYRLLLNAPLVLLARQPHAGGVRVYHAPRLRVHVEHPLDVSLDGEIAGRLPSDFALAPNALRVITPRAFEDEDDQSMVDRAEHAYHALA